MFCEAENYKSADIVQELFRVDESAADFALEEATSTDQNDSDIEDV
jgi:hypothetical protein